MQETWGANGISPPTHVEASVTADKRLRSLKRNNCRGCDAGAEGSFYKKLGAAPGTGHGFWHDENLLEIKGSPRLAQIYLAEFLRLYEHYRARALAINRATRARLPLVSDRDRPRWGDTFAPSGPITIRAQGH